MTLAYTTLPGRLDVTEEKAHFCLQLASFRKKHKDKDNCKFNSHLYQ